MRTLSEILKDMDKTKCPKEIRKLYFEVFDNKVKYPLCEVLYLNEHTINHIKTVAEKDAKELKEFFKSVGFKPWKED